MTEPRTVPTGNVYDKYETSNPIERRLVEGFLSTLTEYVRSLGNVQSILDVGCGEGHVAMCLRECVPDASYCALDIDRELVAEATADDPDAGTVVASACELPWRDRQFDLVLALEVLEHIDRPELALAEIARVTRHASIISVPNEPLWRVLNMARGAYLSDLGNTPGHLQHWGGRSFRRFLQTELEVVDMRRPLPWLMALCRRGPDVHCTPA
ncbi:MAG: class I SAM-dependent methyltransferase [Armatimonadota bacterium]